MAAPEGNKNAAKAKVWAEAIKRALAKRSKIDQHEAIDALAEKLLDVAMTGDLAAIKEFGDRMDGKPGQQVHVEGNGENGALVLTWKS